MLRFATRECFVDTRGVHAGQPANLEAATLIPYADSAALCVIWDEHEASWRVENGIAGGIYELVEGDEVCQQNVARCDTGVIIEDRRAARDVSQAIAEAHDRCLGKAMDLVGGLALV